MKRFGAAFVGIMAIVGVAVIGLALIAFLSWWII
jgi:hypothetical protein